MKREERVLLNKKDIKEAVLWLCREESNAPDSYEFDRDVKVEIRQVDQFKTSDDLYIEATLSWKDDD